MRKGTWYYWLDVAMFCLAVLLVLSSFLLWIVFPRGYHAARALWVDIHKWGGLGLTVLAALHVLLHGKWLLRKTRGYAESLIKRRWRL
jgi:hypothetical protein